MDYNTKDSLIENTPVAGSRRKGATGSGGGAPPGNGILNNELYRGILTYNRQRFVRDPETGKRQARPNPRSEWTVQEVPHLRILDDALWERVQMRRRAGVDTRLDPTARKAPLPLSALLRCGVCGGAMTIQGRRRYSCSKRREGSNCAMDRSIPAAALEERAIAGLVDWAAARRDWPSVLARAAEELTLRHGRLEAEIEETRQRIGNVLQMIERGGTAVSLHQRLTVLEQQAAALEIERAGLVRPPAKAPADLAARLRGELAGLAETIAGTRAPRARHDALLRLAGLIEGIAVAPGEKRRETVVTVKPRKHALVTLALERSARSGRSRKGAAATPGNAKPRARKSRPGKSDEPAS